MITLDDLTFTFEGIELSAVVFGSVSYTSPIPLRMPRAKRISPTSISITHDGRTRTVPVFHRKLSGRANRQGSSLAAIMGSDATLTPIRAWTAPAAFAPRPSHIADEVTRAVADRPIRFPRHYWSNDER